MLALGEGSRALVEEALQVELEGDVHRAAILLESLWKQRAGRPSLHSGGAAFRGGSVL